MHYARVAGLDSELAEPARAGRDVCERLRARDDAGADRERDAAEPCADSWTARRAAARGPARRRRSRLTGVRWSTRRSSAATSPRRAYFAARSELDPSLEATALQRAQQVVELHRESKNKNRHLLALADLYAELSRRYARRNPPPSLGFDPATFDEYAHSATRIYEVVAQQDGTIEKLEAAHKLEAYLSYSLQVHEDKLPQ